MLGLSADSPKKQRKFADKHDLPFPMLCDEGKETLAAYGVWKEKKFMGRKYMGIERATVIVDEKGRIAKVFPKVQVNGHAEEVLKAL